jgi:hypothetical protein
MQIKNIYGSVLFTSQDETNKTLKDVVVEAAKSGAKLYGANLSRADLSGAKLSGANLYGADLYGANLSRADLYGANLSRADLSGADLSGADLSGAKLSWANLSRADLSGAKLSGADLSGADLKDVKNEELALARTFIVPENGNFEGWKKCQNGVIVRLRIPEDAKRSNGSGRKCRASKVMVLEIFNGVQGISQYDSSVIYRKGETVVPDSFDENRWDICSHGIHFYLTRIEAENN